MSPTPHFDPVWETLATQGSKKSKTITWGWWAFFCVRTRVPAVKKHAKIQNRRKPKIFRGLPKKNGKNGTGIGLAKTYQEPHFYRAPLKETIIFCINNNWDRNWGWWNGVNFSGGCQKDLVNVRRQKSARNLRQVLGKARPKKILSVYGPLGMTQFSCIVRR